jgi:hypothetical protein
MAADRPDHALRWEEPPETARRGSGQQSGEVITNLRAAAERPGEWARIATYPTASSASTVAGDLRSGRRARSKPAGRWEFKSGRADGGGYGVWACYLGPDAVA